MIRHFDLYGEMSFVTFLFPCLSRRKEQGAYFIGIRPLLFSLYPSFPVRRSVLLGLVSSVQSERSDSMLPGTDLHRATLIMKRSSDLGSVLPFYPYWKKQHVGSSDQIPDAYTVTYSPYLWPWTYKRKGLSSCGKAKLTVMDWVNTASTWQLVYFKK